VTVSEVPAAVKNWLSPAATAAVLNSVPPMAVTY
jgi:hypothetical protein